MQNFVGVWDNYGHLYWQGLQMTVQLTAISLIIGFIMAWFMALMLLSRRHWLRIPVRAVVYYATGTPLLVQLFLVYFGLGQFAAIRESVLWHILQEPYWCALIAFSLNTAAYSAEIFAGAIKNTAAGEVEAAHSCGMDDMAIFTRIVAPSAFRRALPAYGNEVIFLMHSSSLASIVTILDLTGAMRVAARGTFAFTESYLIAIVLYMALTAVLVAAVKIGERFMLAHLRPAT